MTGKTEDSVDLLHSLGYLYLRMGQERRALVLLLLANRVAPDDRGVLRSLTAAFLENNTPKRALAALDRLIDLDPQDDSAAELLRIRALWQLGETAEARRRFKTYLARKHQTQGKQA